MPADMDDVAAFAALAREHDLDCLVVEEGAWRLEIVRRLPTPSVAPLGEPASPVAPSQMPPAVASAPESLPGEIVAAPIVGVFYRAPSPGAPPFVAVGDRVRIGQTLCIIEAMKLMNEITSDVAGVVAALCVENGELVTRGQALFRIVPE